MPDLFVAKQEERKSKKSEIQTPGNIEGHSGYTNALEKTSSAPAAPTKKKPQHHVSAVTAFCEFPANISFENQERHEIIHLFIRRHFVTNMRWILMSSLLLLAPPLLIFFVLPLFESLSLQIPLTYLFVITCFYYLLLFLYAFLNYVSWFYNVGILTNMRAVDIDLSDITHKNVAATALVDIVDVEYNQQGFLQNTFDYGNVQIQTEGLKANFEYLIVPHPGKVADVIHDLLQEIKE